MDIPLDPTDLDAFLRQREVGLLVAFGSRVAGTAHSDSDLDLGVLRVDGRALVHRELADLLADLQGRASMRVDVVDLAAADTLLRYEVVRNHRILFALDRERWVDFAARTLIDYDDLLPFLNELIAGVARRAARLA